MWDAFCERLSQQLDQAVEFKSNRSLSGGCINHAQELTTNRGKFFVKLNQPSYLPMFEAEAEGLKAIKQTGTIRCPNVIFSAEVAEQAFLCLEYIPMQPAQPGSMERLGQQLAELHRSTATIFGWNMDNTIGLTPQLNQQESDWITFFRKHRLGFQLNLCEQKGLRLQGAEKLLEQLPAFFVDHDPRPALLHGDLWGGNVGFDDRGDPVVFDPACYHGDRETDLAFTEMFGGFLPEFYKAYENSFPLDAGYQQRKRLYNLYHELNHYYLFGGGYANQAQETVWYLLNEL